MLSGVTCAARSSSSSSRQPSESLVTIARKRARFSSWRSLRRGGSGASTQCQVSSETDGQTVAESPLTFMRKVSRSSVWSRVGFSRRRRAS